MILSNFEPFAMLVAVGIGILEVSEFVDWQSRLL